MKKSELAKNGHLAEIYSIAKKKGLNPRHFKTDQKYTTLLVQKNGIYKFIDGYKLGYYPSTSKHFIELCNSKIESEKQLNKLGYKILNSIAVKPNTFENFDTLSKFILSNLPAKYPLLIKPEVGLKGKGIHIVNSDKQLLASARKMYSANKSFLLQETMFLTEYRILFALGEVVFVHSKGFPTISGDNKKTANEHFHSIEPAKRDRRFYLQNLHKMGLTGNSIIATGITVPYHVTRKGTFDAVFADNIPTGIKRWTKKLGKALGSDTIGIDVFIDGSFDKDTSYRIIEINANPGFTYIKNKYKRADIVERHCNRILDSCF